MKISCDKSLTIKTENKNKSNLAVVPLEKDGLSISISHGLVSKSYGQKFTAPIARYTKTTTGDANFLTVFYPLLDEVNVSEVTKSVNRFLKKTKKVWYSTKIQ